MAKTQDKPDKPAWEESSSDGVFPPSAVTDHDNAAVPAADESSEARVEESKVDGEPAVTWSPEDGTPDGLPGVEEAAQAEKDLAAAQDAQEPRPALKGVAEDLAAAWPPDSAPGWGDDKLTPQEG